MNPYWTSLLISGLLIATALIVARHLPVVSEALRIAIPAVIVFDAASFIVQKIAAGSFRAATDLPLSLCDAAAFVAAYACIRPKNWAVEVTYFWGLAGTLQALITPDLTAPFPSLVFFQYLTSHLAVVSAALYLVAVKGMRPKPGAVYRVLIISILYTALVAAVDFASGADYMFLRHKPPSATMLNLLGPWPWYIFTAIPVAIALFALLDLPFDRNPLAFRHSRATAFARSHDNAIKTNRN